MEEYKEILVELELDVKKRREEQRMQNRRNVAYLGMIAFIAGVALAYFATENKTAVLGMVMVGAGLGVFVIIMDENPFNL